MKVFELTTAVKRSCVMLDWRTDSKEYSNFDITRLRLPKMRDSNCRAPRRYSSCDAHTANASIAIDCFLI